MCVKKQYTAHKFTSSPKRMLVWGPLEFIRLWGKGEVHTGF